MSSAFAIAYDLRDAAAHEKALRDRAYWGRLYTEVCFLDEVNVVLTFHPAPDPRWRRWEEARRRMILGDKAAA